jgi:rhamnogalacturonan endolyase
MAVSDTKQRFMPSPDDLLPTFSEKLAYPEAVRMITPKNVSFRGEVIYK